MQIVIILTRNLYENIKLKTTCKFQEQSVFCKNLVFALFYFSLLSSLPRSNGLIRARLHVSRNKNTLAFVETLN